MAEQQKPVTFSGGMIKDVSPSFLQEGVWTEARNATLFSDAQIGITGELSNEPSNLLCSNTPYRMFSNIPIRDGRWVVFSTDETDSEIGIWDERRCTYKTVVNDRCLNFSKFSLITGAVLRNTDGTESVYFADGSRNPDRVLNLDRVPKKVIGTTVVDDCVTTQYSDELDCEAILLNRKNHTPTVRLAKGVGSGLMPNGSYQAVVAYRIKGTRVTDYFPPSNVQSLFAHEGAGGALEIYFSGLDTRFEEFELVLISQIAGQPTARRIGVHSTRKAMVYVDIWNESLPAVPLETLPLRNPIYHASDKMFTVNDYLLRSGMYMVEELNYQSLANDIRAKWIEVEYPADYYYKGGTNGSYLRDENYAFFIRWVYGTGHRSASFHIPGRAPTSSDTAVAGNSGDVIDSSRNRNWQVNNTAQRNATSSYGLGWDGRQDDKAPNGRVVGSGSMGYHETEETYSAHMPQVWGTLCGKKVRLHKFPDHPVSHTNNNDGTKIYVLGIQFENIQAPQNLDGSPTNDVVGYEILRVSREGNKTIIAKGMINNYRQYNIPDSNRKGLYQNYPLNDLNDDKYLSESLDGSIPLHWYRKNLFSFHSPDTNFRKPSLTTGELKVHGEVWGKAEGKFEPPYKHPEHKLITNTTFGTSLLIGVLMGLLEGQGKSMVSRGMSATDDADGWIALNTQAAANAAAATTGSPVPIAVATGLTPLHSTYPFKGFSAMGYTEAVTAGLGGGYSYDLPSIDREGGLGHAITRMIPAIGDGPRRIAELAFTVAQLPYLASKHGEAAMRLIRSFVSRQQYAVQSHTHGYYPKYESSRAGHRRRSISLAQYTDDAINDLDGTDRVNNLFRNGVVTVKVDRDIDNPVHNDNSRRTIGDLGYHSNPYRRYESDTAAHIASLKVELRNQYGPPDSGIQLPIHSGVHAKQNGASTSPVLFGGDVYINRYTERTSMPFFHNWQFDVNDETEYDYRKYINIPYPMYWATFEPFDFSDFGVSFGTPSLIPLDLGINFTTPSDFHKLDGNNTSGMFVVKKRYFYLFNSGVRDFFIESEVNLAQRDWGQSVPERHYAPYGGFSDLAEMFRSDRIKEPILYKYDYSLSVSKFLSQQISWGKSHPLSYDPNDLGRYHSYMPERVTYSFPYKGETSKESWRMFLAGNYRDFGSRVTAIKALNRTGALVLMENSEPTSFSGVDELKTSSGTKLTIGDGGLFNQAFQSLVNADDSMQYGSCQSAASVINTPFGTFYISQRAGKIFQTKGDSISDICRNGMEAWFSEYLPSNILTAFPDYPVKDNPVAGIGCTAVYDPNVELVYFTKRDWAIREHKDGKYITWDDRTKSFQARAAGGSVIGTVVLGDPAYFEDASWTRSYDPKRERWISYHDWHPAITFSTERHFAVGLDDGIWKHNIRTDSFCNFFDKSYPFEVEFPISTGIQETVLQSIEFRMNSYVYEKDVPVHVLDHTFDWALLLNSEQVSGWRKLLIAPKNRPSLRLEYPKVFNDRIEILVSKEENKFRFNQFWDIRKDRGEFSGANQPFLIRDPRGSTRIIDPDGVNYSKGERKRFRHNLNTVLLRRVLCDRHRMVVKAVSPRQNPSAR